MGGLLGAFVTRMPYTNVTNSSSLLRESGQGLVNHLSYPEISRQFPQTQTMPFPKIQIFSVYLFQEKARTSTLSKIQQIILKIPSTICIIIQKLIKRRKSRGNDIFFRKKFGRFKKLLYFCCRFGQAIRLIQEKHVVWILVSCFNRIGFLIEHVFSCTLNLITQP